MTHKPVLCQEVLHYLDPQAGETVVDATLNRGGHAALLAERVGERGVLVGIDLDAAALAAAESRLSQLPLRALILRQGNFRNLGQILDSVGLPKVDRILFDLGWSAEQMSSSGRGFSFERDEPLLMTLAEPEATPDSVTAADVVNSWSEESLATILHGYGNERFARRIAAAIATARRGQPISTAAELVAIIAAAVPAWYQHGRRHFATKTFQAIRIAVNDELNALTQALPIALKRLRPGGRLVAISFHDLEARIVKNFCREAEAAGQGRRLAKRAVKPTRTELQENPRARSAELRGLEKI